MDLQHDRHVRSEVRYQMACHCPELDIDRTQIRRLLVRPAVLIAEIRLIEAVYPERARHRHDGKDTRGLIVTQ